MSDRTIRPLEPFEWVELQDVLIEQFAEGLPDPVDTRIFVIEEDGKRVGFMQIEAVERAHIRHIFLEPEHRGNGAAEELVDYVRDLFRKAGKRGHLVATDPFAERLAERAGMKRIDGILYEGDGQ